MQILTISSIDDNIMVATLNITLIYWRCMMKNPNELKKHISFRLNECDSLKNYLEEIALKGWKLKSVKNGFRFEKITPQELHYSVEILAKRSFYDTTPTKEENDYIGSYKNAGWEYVSIYEQMIIFVSETEKTLPIETDQKLKFKVIRNSIFKQNILFQWFVFLPILIFILSFDKFESIVNDNLNILY